MTGSQERRFEQLRNSSLKATKARAIKETAMTGLWHYAPTEPLGRGCLAALAELSDAQSTYATVKVSTKIIFEASQCSGTASQQWPC